MKVIMVSACLMGENCKYNGGNNRNDKLAELLSGRSDITVITVCPEVMGGLPTPRVPAEIKNGVVTNRDGISVDAEYRRGAAKCLEIAEREQPELIILQSRSPSCGVKQRYDGSFSGRLTDDPGITAALLMEHGFRVKDIADIKEISDLVEDVEDIKDIKDIEKAGRLNKICDKTNNYA